MTMVSLGDLARSLMLQRHTTASNDRLNRVTQELASGRHSDIAAANRGDLSPLAAIEGALSHINGWQVGAKSLSMQLDAMQSALGALNGIATSMADTLVAAGGATQPTQVALAAHSAGEHLEAAVGLLNARAADRSVFAGTRGDSPAMIGADELMAALLPVVSGAETAEDVQAAVQAWFDDPAGFDTLAYRGGQPQPAIAVGPGESASPSVTATDPALKSLLAGLAMSALMDRGVLNDSPAESSKLARLSGESLMSTATERTMLAARVGITQSRLTEAQTRNSAEETALGIARAGLVSSDPYASATELEAARTQLETLYALTSRLSGLSLIGALR